MSRVGHHTAGSLRLIGLGLGNHLVQELVSGLAMGVQDHVAVEVDVRRLLVLIDGKVDRPLLFRWLALG